MKTKNLNSTLAILITTLMMVLFNNFAFISPKARTAQGSGFETVSEASRVEHAKELLGRSYAGSDAQKIEGRKSLNYVIYNNVQSNLTPQWKSHARGIAQTVISESKKYHLDPVFVLAVIKTESKFNQYTVGSHGEIGLMQIKPDTAEWIANKFGITWQGEKTLRNPESNIRIGLAYMNYLRTQFNGKATKYVSAYNMGPRNVRRLLARNVKPAEYNSRVMKNYAYLYSNIADLATSTKVAAN